MVNLSILKTERLFTNFRILRVMTGVFDLDTVIGLLAFDLAFFVHFPMFNRGWGCAQFLFSL